MTLLWFHHGIGDASYKMNETKLPAIKLIGNPQ